MYAFKFLFLSAIVTQTFSISNYGTVIMLHYKTYKQNNTDKCNKN